MTDMLSERDHTVMSLWHDLLNNKEYMTCDGKYYVADALLVDECLMQQRAIGSLEDENQKLRELASTLCFCMQIHTRCDDCKLNGAKGDMAHDPLLACKGLHAMLRELGIEVP